MTPPRRFAGFSEDDVRKYLEELKNQGGTKPEGKPARKGRKKQANIPAASPVPAVPVSVPKPVQRDPRVFGIEKIADGDYIMHGLPYNGNFCQVRFTTFCIENKAKKPFNDWKSSSISRDIGYVPSMPLEFAVWRELYKYHGLMKDDTTPAYKEIRVIRDELKKTLLENKVLMLSELVYKPKLSSNAKNKDDAVYHFDPLLILTPFSVNLKGSNDELRSPAVSDELCTALFLGTKSLVHDVIYWITGKVPNILRFNNVDAKTSVPFILDATLSSPKCYIGANTVGECAPALGVMFQDYVPLPITRKIGDA